MQVHGQGASVSHRDTIATEAGAAHALYHQRRIDGEFRDKGIAEGFEEPQGDGRVIRQLLVFPESLFQGSVARGGPSLRLERGSVDQRAAAGAFAVEGIPVVQAVILMFAFEMADCALIVLHVMNMVADGGVLIYELGEGKVQFLAVLAGERLAFGQNILQSAVTIRIVQMKLIERTAGDFNIGDLDVRLPEDAAGNLNGAGIKVISARISEIAAGDRGFTAGDEKVPNPKRIAEVEGQLAAA